MPLWHGCFCVVAYVGHYVTIVTRRTVTSGSAVGTVWFILALLRGQQSRGEGELECGLGCARWGLASCPPRRLPLQEGLTFPEVIVHHRVDHKGERTTERALVMGCHRVFAQALVCSLRRQGMAAAYAPPRSAASATRALELSPTVLVLMVGGDKTGLLDSTASVLGHDPSVRILLLAPDVSEAAPYLAALPGVTSILTLHVALRDLLHVVKGTRSVSAVTDRRSIRRPLRAGGETSLVDRLTEREREVLGELMAGTSGDEMAANLRISRNTVRTHVQNILTKLGARTRLEAAAVGRHAGLRPARSGYRAETAEFGS